MPDENSRIQRCEYDYKMMRHFEAPPYAPCQEPVLPDRKYCIFHERQKSAQDASEFEGRIRQMVVNKDYDFAGYCFPKANFSGMVFNGTVDFSNAIFEGDAEFDTTTFEGEADFIGAVFERDASFRSAVFKQHANFEHALFTEGADFISATFEWGALFHDAAFKSEERTGICESNFSDAHFRDYTSFEGAYFESIANFIEATFEKDAVFKNVAFQEDGCFSGVNCGDEISFNNTKFKYPNDKEIAYRLSKTSFQRTGRYDEAGECYYIERVAKWQCLRWRSRSFFRKLLELIFLRGTCGYGERPYFVVSWVFGVIAIYAFLYYGVGHINSIAQNGVFGWGDAVYFSSVTFFTLGFGGPWYPSPEHWIKYMVASEGFAGAFLMALFVMTFGRRMMR